MDNFYKFCKGMALLLPTLIGCILVKIVALEFTHTMTDIKILEVKMNSMVGIIGVAVSVWIGLNVYNLIEKNEIEHKMNSCIKNYSDFETKINKDTNNLREELRTSKENLQKLKNELKRLCTCDSGIQISRESVKQIDEELIYNTVKSIIENYSLKNENLLIFLDYNFIKNMNPEKEYLTLDLRSNQDLNPEHIKSIMQLISSFFPELKMTPVIYGRT